MWKVLMLCGAMVQMGGQTVAVSTKVFLTTHRDCHSNPTSHTDDRVEFKLHHGSGLHNFHDL